MKEQELDVISISGSTSPAAADSPSTPNSKPQQSINPLDALRNSQTADWEPVDLPSLGVYYDSWETGMVQVKPMGIEAEKAFANRRKLANGSSVSNMLDECVILQNGMSTDELLIGDRTFLFYYIRGLTFGADYEFITTCKYCDHKFTAIYDMSELWSTRKAPMIDPQTGEYLQEPFRLVLPDLSERLGVDINIGLRLLRHYDIANISKSINTRFGEVRAHNRGMTKNPADVPIDPADQISQNLKMVITDVAGDDSEEAKDLLLSRITSVDTGAIRDFLKDITPGIDVMVEIPCPECGEVSVIELPITDSYFRKVSRKPGTRQ